MKLYSLLLAIVSVAFVYHAKANTNQIFDKQEYYRILKTGNINEIDDEIDVVEKSSLTNKDAFEGTLLMKKAGLVKKPKDKLDLFKSGRIKLETEISKNNSTTEFRFLRLIIEEHAPKVVKYRANINDDAAFIVKNFKNLSPDVQQIVIDYSKNSEPLKALNFQP